MRKENPINWLLKAPKLDDETLMAGFVLAEVALFTPVEKVVGVARKIRAFVSRTSSKGENRAS